MKGLRKVSKPRPGSRRFEGTRDDAHRKMVAQRRCLIAGKRITVTRWKGAYPNKVEVTEEYQHACGWGKDPHHVTTKARGGHDRETVPLCGLAHKELHQHGWRAFEKRYGVDLRASVGALSERYERENAE